MSKAQASMFTELRAPKGFTSLYQGLSADIPIVLSAFPSGLDPRAEEQFSRLKNEFSKNGGTYPINTDGKGISPFLVAGTPVPLFSSVLLVIPAINAGGDSTPAYRYALYWRIRSFATAASARNPFHGRNSTLGPTDDGQNRFDPPIGGPAWSGTAIQRFPIISGGDSLMYAQTEPTVTDAYALQNNYQVITVPDQPYVAPPRFRGFTSSQQALGEVSQGLTQNPSFLTGAPKHVPTITRSFGDELVVLVFRESTDAAPNWDFESAGVDADFPIFYGEGRLRDGVKSLGMLVSTGLAP